MAPKQKTKAADLQKAVFSEVEKAFYELQLADCNRKVARLRKAAEEYELRNEELEKAYETLDEDRADIIAYLKKTLNVKTEENTELKEKVKDLEELRVIETSKFKLTVAELERNFTNTKDQLTSENKLLAGKLNTLEEFRAIRGDLMKKFAKQERALEDQEMKYKRIIYDIEKKFIIGKDKLKKEMEERLLQLAQQFQDTSEQRIAASTHRVIRENIALNDQLESLFMTQATVAEQNEKFKEDERASWYAMEVAEKERDKAINKSIVQLKVIGQLTAAYKGVKKLKSIYEKKQFDSEKAEMNMQKLTKDNKNLLLQVRILEQNLHAALAEKNKTVVETAKLLRERETFKNVLRESTFVVQAALKLDQWSILDPSREISDRETVLKRILEVINQYRDIALAESMESLVSLSNIYEKGDLGFDIEPVLSKKSLAVQAGVVDKISQQSVDDKRSSVSASASMTSMHTIPSINLIILEEEEPLRKQDSLPSFTVTSLHSSVSYSTIVSAEKEGEMTDIKKLLAISKVEMQKSLMADLAFSQRSQQKMSAMNSHSKLDSTSLKSLDATHQKAADIPSDNIEDEQQKIMPEEDTSQAVQNEDEPTQDIPLTADEQGDEEDKKKTSAE